MNRHWLLLLSLTTVLVLAACSDNNVNQPPTVTIVYPDSGHHVVSSPDSVVADAQDDRAVARVDFYFDGNLYSSISSAPYISHLPLGTYANGQEYVVGARAIDSDGVPSAVSNITMTIDPALQTVPQITTFDLDQDGSGNLRLSWLPFPETVSEYQWEVSRDDGFFGVLASGSVTDTTLVVAVIAEGLAYARVRAVLPDATTDWSRIERFNQLDTWRMHYPATGPQLGTGIYQATDGTLRILSHGVDRHRVSKAAVELLALDAANELVTVHQIFDDTYRPTAQALDAAGDLRLAGVREDSTGFVAAVSLDGMLRWSTPADFMRCSAMLDEGGTWRTVGVDLRDGADGGVFATIGDDGTITAGPTFRLETGREVNFAWPRPAGGWVVAGQLPDADNGQPGGVWVRGLDASYQEEWNLRVGTGSNYLLRGGGVDGAGNYVLGGIALRQEYLSRFGFIFGFDADGRVRFQVTDRNWHLFANAYPDAGGRWTVTGVRNRSIDGVTNYYDFAMAGFSAAGLPLWQVQYRKGEESQGWAIAPHPNGGWWSAGLVTYNFVEMDVDVLRVDDRGEFD